MYKGLISLFWLVFFHCQQWHNLQTESLNRPRNPRRCDFWAALITFGTWCCERSSFQQPLPLCKQLKELETKLFGRSHVRNRPFLIKYLHYRYHSPICEFGEGYWYLRFTDPHKWGLALWSHNREISPRLAAEGRTYSQFRSSALTWQIWKEN